MMRPEAFPFMFDAALPAVPPAFVFLAGAVAVALVGPRTRLRQALLLAVPILGLLNLAALESDASWVWRVLDFELEQLRVDRLSMLFGLLFHIGALLGVIYALGVRDASQHVAALAYAGSALGAVFAGDLISLFFYWEGMAVASTFLVWARRNKLSYSAGLRYLVLHMLSGLLLLGGAIASYRATGGISFDFIGTETVGGWLILAAIGIKCGFPLLHNWIVDAYPQSTASGTVFLSIFTTKVAVYALARGFPGTELLIIVGTVMAVFPIFYAVIENDLRRVLGYSMINQIGFMVAGIGVGTELALNGAVAHAFAHIIYKGLLFMSMGAVLLRVGHVLGSDLGGLYKSMPLTMIFCIIGAASISAFPLFSGFVAKSMIMAAMIENGSYWQWLALLFASAGVFHHAGIKVPYFAFFGHDAGIRVAEAPRNMLIAMALAAIGCIFIGVYPSGLYALLPWEVDYVPYTYPHVIVQLQLLLFSALAFAWLKLTGIYPSELRSVNLDVDWVYRRFLPRVAQPLIATAASAWLALRRFVDNAAAALSEALRPGRSMRPPMGSGMAVLLVSAALAGYLFVYFVSRA